MSPATTATTVQPISDPARTPRPVARTGLLAGGALMASAAVVQAAGNLGFHAVVSRGLPGSDYSTLVVLLTVVLLVTVPLGSIQVAFATARARDLHGSPTASLRRLASVLIGATAVLAVLSGPLAGFLHLPSTGLALMIAPYLAVAGLAAALRGLRLGEQRIRLVATSIVVSTLIRIVAGIVLVRHLGVAGGLLATLLAEAVGLLMLCTRTDRGVATQALRIPATHVLGTLLAMLGLWCFTGIDAILARHFLPTTAADQYVTAGVITRSALAIPVAFIMASIASFAGDATTARRTLRRLYAVLAVWAAASTIGLALLGGVVQSLLFGTVRTDPGLLVALGAIAGVSAFVTLLTYFHLARGSKLALLPWAAAAVEVVLIVVLHASVWEIAAGSAIALGLAVFSMAITVGRTTDELVDEQEPLSTAVTPPWVHDDRLWQPAADDVELSVVVPFYNPGPSVGTTVGSIVDLLRAEHVGFEVIAVSDGATDGSEAHVEAVGAPEVHLVVQPVNQGKGAALQRGFASARGRYIAFIDADGDIDPSHLVDYLTRIREGGDLVYASKRHPQSMSESSPFRKLVSLGFMTVTGSLFRLGVGDTQTGCKVLRRELVADVLPWLQERRFAMDLELFVVAKRRGHLDMRPAPVHLGERLAGSTVTTKAIVRTLRDTLTIWRRRYVDRAYGPASVSTAPLVAAPESWPTAAPALIAA